MVKSNSILLFLFLSLILSSCGEKTNSPTIKSTAAPTFLTLTEGSCQSTEKSQLYEDSQNLSNRIETFIQSYNKKVSREVRKLSSLNSSNTNLFIQSSPLEPLVLGKARLAQKLRELELTFKHLIGEGNYKYLINSAEGSFLVSILSEESRAKFDWLIAQTRELLTKSLRWQSLQCSLGELSKRKSRDVRKYYFFLERKNDPLSNLEQKSEAALNLCGDFHSPVICLSEQSILKRKNLLESFNDHYERMGLEKTDIFFKRHGTHRFSCSKSDGQTILEIPYLANQVMLAKSGLTHSQIESEVSKRWSNSQMKVVLRRVSKLDEGVLNFQWKSGGLSFVDRSDPLTINLSEYLSGNLLMLTLNHEMGHVLGFPDCYHEFYDKKTQEIIYYSLDQKAENLMCTMSSEALIPKLYFDQLLESACSYR